MSPVGVFFFVDRISDGFATLLWEGEGGGDVTLPVSLLPESVREGDLLRASFEVDRVCRDAMRGEVQNLLDELGDDP